MATKLQLVTAMYEHQLHRMTVQPGVWQQFLLAAGRNYRLSFEEQLQVFAQRPDATAVLELDKWNKTFNRWVNRGAAGIAVIDRASLGKRRLKYYFDIADTHESEYKASRHVPIRAVRPDHRANVVETLEANFGDLADKQDLAHAIISAANNAVSDNMADYLSDLMNCREGSFLEELDDLNVEVFLKEALQNSVAYLWLARCGVDPTLFFEQEDFRRVFEFSTPDTLTVLGTAVSDIAEMGLREIASTVLALEKTKREANRTFADGQNISDNNDTSKRGRSYDHDRGDTTHYLHGGERISDSRPDTAGRTRSRTWQIRLDAPALPDESPQVPVQPLADERRLAPAPDGNRADVDGTAGASEQGNGGSRGRDRADEIDRPDGMDSADDIDPQPGRGNDTARINLHINQFPSPEEQQHTIREAEGAAQEPTPSAFSMPIPQEVVDFEFARFGGAYNQRLRIFHWFESLHTEDEAAEFLKREFGTGGHSALNGFAYSVSHDRKGITFTKSDPLIPMAKYTLSWNKAAKRVQELIDADRFLSTADKVFYPQYLEHLENRDMWRQKNAALDAALTLPIPERRATLAPRLVDFLNGLNEDARYLNECLTGNGLPEIADTANIAQMEAILANPQQTQQLTDAMKAIAGAATGVFERNHGYRFREELCLLYERRPVYHLGDTAYIGTHAYEVLAFDDSKVTLFDTEFPILNTEMSRAEFDRKIAANPLNEHLLAAVADQTAPEVAPSEKVDPQHGATLPEPATDNGLSAKSRGVVQTPLFEVELVELHISQKGEPEQTGPAITPAWEKKENHARAITFDAFSNVPMSERHNFRITEDNLGRGGAKAKFRANMDAIHILRDLELDRRLATPEEQEILSCYVGWGSLDKAFKENDPGWENKYIELKAALSNEEYESARATTLNAHYTSPTVIKAIYKAVENMGFSTGNILDPGCGIGNFQGLLPDSMSDSKVYGIEIDPITGRIAQQLYQKNSIAIQGYEKTALPDSFFDLAIGNVPFGGYGVSDKKYDKHHFHIHDYFFGATRS